MAKELFFSPDPTTFSAQKLLPPNFGGSVDFQNPKKNIPQLEELAGQLGLAAIKGVITKNTLQFFQPDQNAINKQVQFAEQLGDSMPIVGYSTFGFPVFSNLLIAGDSYQDNDGKTIGQFKDIRLDVVLMETEREKNIVKTDIRGQDGTVIEYISAKSAKVKVLCRILAQTPGVYPIDDVTNLVRALSSNKALRVTSWFLAMRGIYNIVVEKDSIKQAEGEQEFQRFEFDAIADRPIILKLSK